MFERKPKKTSNSTIATTPVESLPPAGYELTVVDGVDTAADEESIGVFNKEAVEDEAQVEEAGVTTTVPPQPCHQIN